MKRDKWYVLIGRAIDPIGIDIHHVITSSMSRENVRLFMATEEVLRSYEDLKVVPIEVKGGSSSSVPESIISQKISGIYCRAEESGHKMYEELIKTLEETGDA